MDVVSNPGIALAGWLLATLLLSYLANYWLSRILLGRTYRILIGPGIIVHEYAHALGCVLTGTRIRSLSVFSRTGGQVIHDEPANPLFQGIITIAPIILAALLISLSGNLRQFGLGGTLLFAYLATTLAVTMAPSKQDLRVGAAGVLLLCVVLGLGGWWLDLRVTADLAGSILISLGILGVVTGAAGMLYAVAHRRRPPGTRYTTFE